MLALPFVKYQSMPLSCEIYNDLKRKGKMLDDADLLIGCTAIAKGYKLFTNNKKHFERLKDYGLKFYKEGEDDK